MCPVVMASVIKACKRGWHLGPAWSLECVDMFPFETHLSLPLLRAMASGFGALWQSHLVRTNVQLSLVDTHCMFQTKQFHSHPDLTETSVFCEAHSHQFNSTVNAVKLKSSSIFLYFYVFKMAFNLSYKQKKSVLLDCSNEGCLKFQHVTSRFLFIFITLFKWSSPRASIIHPY